MSDDVLSKIRAGASSWEEDVPQSVAKAIKAFELFGYHKGGKSIMPHIKNALLRFRIIDKMIRNKYKSYPSKRAKGSL